MLIACDPGTKYCAFSVYKKGKLVGCYKVKATFHHINAFFNELNTNDFEMVIEDQYLHLNVNTLKKLVRVRSIVETLAMVFNGGKECYVVSPQSWQTIELGVHIKSKRDQRKRVSCMVASAIAKKEIKDNDIADAVCIGDYVIRKNKVAGM